VIVLASASPRRRELLRTAGLEFAVDPAGVDESVDDSLAPEAAAVELARRKARAVAARRADPSDLVIGADTIVAVPDRASRSGFASLGKPLDAHDARRMLRALSGSRHAVVTGVAVARAADQSERAGARPPWVTMRALAPEEIEAYAASGEGLDKAGGYAIQETADRFVTRLEGALDNVVGLPVDLVFELLAEFGARLVRASPRG